MINQAIPRMQGKRIGVHRPAALSLSSRAGPSFLFKVMVVVLAALAALAI